MNQTRLIQRQGSIKRFQEGSKFDWGKLLSNVAPIILSTISKNKKQSAEDKISEAAIDYEVGEKMKSIPGQADYISKQLIQSNIDPENPNSLGGDVVQQYLSGQISNKFMEELRQDAKNKKAMLRAQSQQNKSDNWGNAFEGILTEGLGQVANYFSNKKNATPSKTSVTDSTVNNTSSGMFTQNSYLNDSNTFWGKDYKLTL